MIILNGKKFALNDKEFTNSLFEKGGTCIGYYKPLKRKIKLFNSNKEMIGVITDKGVLACATLQDDGKYWYSHANIKEIGDFDTHMKELSDIRKALLNLRKV